VLYNTESSEEKITCTHPICKTNVYPQRKYYLPEQKKFPNPSMKDSLNHSHYQNHLHLPSICHSQNKPSPPYWVGQPTFTEPLSPSLPWGKTIPRPTRPLPQRKTDPTNSSPSLPQDHSSPGDFIGMRDSIYYP
jgi:hypothetical protein